MAATRYATTADGISLAYWSMGEGDVPIIVSPVPLMSSAFAELDIEPCRSFYERLARNRRVVRFDHRGTGRSSLEVGAPTQEAFDADLAAIVDATGAAEVDLFGMEDAGPVATRYAAAHPDRVRRLILWGTWASPADIGEAAAVQELEKLMTHNFPMWIESAVAVIWRWPGADGRAYADALKRSTVADNVRAFLEAAWQWDALDACAAVRAPTLVVHRQDNPIFIPEAGAKLAARLTDASRVVLEGDSQYPWVGDVDAVLRVVEEHLGGGGPDIGSTEFATVLFTDIVASTERTALVGDRQWSDVLDQFESVVRREIARYDGREIFTKGDEFLITFASPGRGVRCAIAIRDAAKAEGLELRTGLHAGEIHRRGKDITGIGVNIGARVAAAAAPGEILVSRTVVDLLAGSDIRFSDRGERELKGLSGTWRLHATEP
jgi:class 3 adenylate cyclase